MLTIPPTNSNITEKCDGFLTTGSFDKLRTGSTNVPPESLSYSKIHPVVKVDDFRILFRRAIKAPPINSPNVAGSGMHCVSIVISSI
jgi:hypothetical protein